MTESQIEDEVSVFLTAIENMKNNRIISISEQIMFRTTIKAWAYDRTKEVLSTEPNNQDRGNTAEPEHNA